MEDTYLERRERAKYMTVWDFPDYRKVSPGEMEAPAAWAAMGCRPGESMTDFGCGTARATKWFMERGLAVLGVDLADNAPETDVPFMPACLWDMPYIPVAAYGFCCDVMEHIPPSKVEQTLRQIAARVERAAWFRIATRPDVMGPRLIGEPLHLTIKDDRWWITTLSFVWKSVDVVRSDGLDLVTLCRP